MILEKSKDLLKKIQFSFFFTNLIYPNIDYSILYITPMKIKKIKNIETNHEQCIFIKICKQRYKLGSRINLIYKARKKRQMVLHRKLKSSVRFMIQQTYIHIHFRIVFPLEKIYHIPNTVLIPHSSMTDWLLHSVGWPIILLYSETINRVGKNLALGWDYCKLSFTWTKGSRHPTNTRKPKFPQEAGRPNASPDP